MRMGEEGGGEESAGLAFGGEGAEVFECVAGGG
jgi:hypothetical protein